jgi:hypothetical protein
LRYTSSPFCFGCLGYRISLFVQTSPWTTIFQFMLFATNRITHICTTFNFFSVDMGSPEIFALVGLEPQSFHLGFCIAGMAGMYHCDLLLVEMRVSQTFCPQWPQTIILQISTSQATRITNVGQWHLAYTLGSCCSTCDP